jgi:uncharacterized protein (TIGR01319 family)
LNRFVIADIGSTTTKAVLFREDGGWSFVRREAPTTVEDPHADVKIGLRASLGALEEASGERLLDGEAPAVPLLLTSSAGGGLAMVVTGLVKEVTSSSAERAALGAGAVVQDVIALNDGRVPYRKIEDLNRLRPDMVLFAGGFDGDAVSGPVFLAELLRQAELHPKLNEEAPLPVLYAGNTNAGSLVRETLGDGYLIRDVPNLRPESDVENLEDARRAIHEMFMEHVMSHAPGYAGLESWIAAPILPTPSALARIMETVTETAPGRFLVVDIGGATTDVFTAENGQVFRTVSANLGLSYSALNVAETGGMETILEVLGETMDESEAWDRIGAKYLDPTRLPGTPRDVLVERAVATAAVRLAVRDHLDVLEGGRLGLSEAELSLRSVGRAKKLRKSRGNRLPLRGYDCVIGSGGILSHSPREATATILVNALEPLGTVELAVDRAFILPHLGVLSRVDAELARRLFHDLALVRLGTLLAPVTRVKSTAATLSVTGLPQRGDVTVPAAEIRLLEAEDGTTHALALKAKGMKLDRKQATATGGVLGIVVDARARPLTDRRAPLFGEPDTPPVDERPSMDAGARIVDGLLHERRELAVSGDVLVEVGDEVVTETPVARTTLLFRRPFFLDVASALEVGPEELAPLLNVGPGDDIVAGDELGRRNRGGFAGPLIYVSPVAGTVEHMLPDGSLVVREKPEHAQGLTTVRVARGLGVPGAKLEPWLVVATGDHVERGQILARRGRLPEMWQSQSPVRGKVSSIDLDFGLVHIAPIRKDLAVDAWLPGRVEAVTARGALVAGTGIHLRGTWGRGAEARGPLAVDRFEHGHVVALTGPRADALTAAAEVGAAALVIGGIPLMDIRAAAPGCPLVLTQGFGALAMNDETADLLHGHDGRLTLVDGTTELRVGVRRPRVILL